MTVQEQIKKEVTLREQLKKFLIKGYYGFNTILTLGLGMRLGIFDYLYAKSKKTLALQQFLQWILHQMNLSKNLVMILNFLMLGFT
ncbi:MAG: hypothetical protein KGD58_09205 [Candidatus Lokiarchaeota archaeon]|nr:hypothetical protein [Candidatus Lokiarchaeota archaeon]